MLKISFWLKKPSAKKDDLEHVEIDSPKKVLEGKLAGLYACEVYLPLPETEKKSILIYATNPIEVFCNASEFAKVYLQGLINRGYVIGEVGSKETWKLEKKDPMVSLQERVKNFSQEEKDKILGVLKDTFGKDPSPIKDQINKLK